MKRFKGKLEIEISWTKEEILKLVRKHYKKVEDLSDEQCQSLVDAFIWNIDGVCYPDYDDRMQLNDAAEDLVEDILEED